MVEREELERLWEIALRDAGCTADDIDLMPVDTDDESFTQSAYLPPHVDMARWPADIGAAPQSTGSNRLVQTVRARGLEERQEAALLGMMRHSLEYFRWHEESRQLYALSLQIGTALESVFADKGKGGAMVWNAIPMIQSANSAAARLVTEQFGPQTGYLRHPEYGPLFRVERDPLEPSERAAATVTFGAIWREELEVFARSGEVLAETAEDFIGDAAPQAVEWWRALEADKPFGSVRETGRLFVPEPEEIQAAPNPAMAWATLVVLLNRAVEYGRAITQA